MEAIYYLYMGDYGRLHGLSWDENAGINPIRIDRKKLSANIFANNYIYLMDILHKDNVKMYRNYPNPHPPLTLVHGQKDDSHKAVGYVIHQGTIFVWLF